MANNKKTSVKTKKEVNITHTIMTTLNITLVVGMIFLFALFIFVNQPANKSTSQQVAPVVLSDDLEANYKNNVLKIKQEYQDTILSSLELNDELDKENQIEIYSQAEQAANKAQEDLIGLRVPEDFKTFHLKIALAYSNFESGAELAKQSLEQDSLELQTESEQIISQAEEQYEALKNTYTWLRGD